MLHLLTSYLVRLLLGRFRWLVDGSRKQPSPQKDKPYLILEQDRYFPDEVGSGYQALGLYSFIFQGERF
jgi:hypothetical protein